MALSFTQLFALQQVGNSPTTLLTVTATPSSNLLRNGRIRFSNTTGAAVTITAWCVPAAGAEGNANVFFPVKSVPANDYIDVDVPQAKAGDIIKAQAGAAASITAAPLDGFVQS